MNTTSIYRRVSRARAANRLAVRCRQQGEFVAAMMAVARRDRCMTEARIEQQYASDRRVGVLVREGRDSGRTIYYATLNGKHIERRSVRGIARVLARHDATSLARAVRA